MLVGGGGRTRTYEGVSQRIYSPPPLPLGTLPLHEIYTKINLLSVLPVLLVTPVLLPLLRPSMSCQLPASDVKLGVFSEDGGLLGCLCVFFV